MSFKGTGIYHWNLGDVALARICQKVYARVRVIKDEKGLFYDDKVLGISANQDGTITTIKELCYYVETCRTQQRLWLPYTCMYLAERSRPYYGTDNNTSPGKKTAGSPENTYDTPRKRKQKEEHVMPLNVKVPKNPEHDLNTTYDTRQTVLKQGKFHNAFKEFIRRGKEMLFDEYFNLLLTNVEENKDVIDFLFHVNASTERKLELVIQKIVSEKEIDNYLHQCWRYNFVCKQTSESNNDNKELADVTNSTSPPIKQPVTVHTPWCLVCGKDEKLRACTKCPASFHLPCRKDWLLTIIHRKTPPSQALQPSSVTLVDKILSSTRTKCTVLNDDKENIEVCPSCMWGPKVGYSDVVWHKLGTCSWWPARVLPPGEVPACLRAQPHTNQHWPLRYYGTLNHSWGDLCRMCLFLPSHTAALEAREPILRQAVLDASDDYITVYLT